MEKTLEKLAQAHRDGNISEAAYNNAKKWLTHEEYREYWEQISSRIQEGNFSEIEDCL